MKIIISIFAVLLILFDTVACLECQANSAERLIDECTVINGRLTVNFDQTTDITVIAKKLENITKITGELEVFDFPNEVFNLLPNCKEILGNGGIAIKFERSAKLKRISFDNLETLKGEIVFKNDHYPINVRKDKRLLQSIVDLEEKTHPDQCIAVKVDMSYASKKEEYDEHELLMNIPSYVKAWEYREMMRFIANVFFVNVFLVMLVTNIFLSTHLVRLKGKKFALWKSPDNGQKFLPPPPAPVKKAQATEKKASVDEKKSVSTEKKSSVAEKKSSNTEKK